MTYAFKLQTVLDHRQLLEDNLKKELADIQQQVLAIQKQLDVMKRKEIKTIDALNQAQAEGLSSDQVLTYHTYLQRLSDRMAKEKTNVETLSVQASAKKDELLEAMKNRKILERLKDQGLERYHREMLKKEMNFIDEMAVNQFVRNALDQNGGCE
jgi:flagellar FliJ protein